MSVTNIHGQVILTQKIEGFKTEVNISDLASGVYCVKIFCEKGIFIGTSSKERHRFFNTLHEKVRMLRCRIERMV